MAPLLPAPAARLIGFACLAGFGARQWGQLVTPTAGGAMWAALLASLAAGGALVVFARTRRPARARWSAGIAAAVLLALVATVGAEVPGSLLEPRGWDDLAAGIGQGLSAVPSVSVPYGGVEEWTRTVLILGGGALVGASALLAFAPRRDGRFGYPVAAAVALGTLYAVPVVQRTGDAPFLAGTAFALLLGLFLWLERVERRNAGLAAALLAVAAVAALVAAPRLDADTSLLDYEEIAQSLSSTVTTQYNWDHTYGKLDWPRDGREVLRVRSPVRAYWKATNLTSFDGLHWIQDGRQVALPVEADSSNRDWLQTIRVTVRALSSTQFVAAGETIDVADSPRASVRSMPGVLETAGRPLRRGHAYQARIYQPRPTTRRLQTAGTDYPAWLREDYGFIRLPGRRPFQSAVVLPFWDAPDAAAERALADAAFAESPYARVYALAQRLRARSASPFAFMRAVERYLVAGFSYSETPPPSSYPLADFLLRDRVGYCQQFSGAMALLLRMGGLPARVSAGFAPGILDEERKEYVVRDVDAHSWVEVFFPGVGWVTRDPTPASSPARSQTADLAPVSQGSQVELGGASERALGGSTDRGLAATQATGGDEAGSSVAGRVAVAVVVIAALALLGAALRRRRRRGELPEDELAELRRALRRSGRDPQPGLTLDTLARRLAGTAAEGYVRALERARYGYGSAAPTREERSALRRELASGLGLRGRLRAWWALPPQRPGLRVRRRHAVLSSEHGR
ncbi:MAG TPA: transglutaminase family protein [Solirubrobacteraceae bacterium]|nr:transglutaminase family protein [Solirubrobacteraceae bacterium]